MLDTKLKNSRKKRIVAVCLVCCLCAIGMIMTYGTIRRSYQASTGTESKIEDAVYSMGENLATGNGFLYNEITEEESYQELLQEYGWSQFELLKKYMDYGMFDENNQSLLKSTDEATAAKLLDQEKEQYAFKAVFTYDFDGELSDVNVTGSALTSEEEFTAEQQYSRNAIDLQDQLGSYGSLENSDGKEVEQIRIIYGMTQENLETYAASIWEDYSNASYMIHITDLYEYALWMLLFLAVAALLLPMIPGVGTHEGKLFRMPFEVAAVLFCFAISGAWISFIREIIYRTINGTLITGFGNFGKILTLSVNFVMWFVCALIIYWILANLRNMLTMKKAYWTEYTLTAKCIHQFKKGYKNGEGEAEKEPVLRRIKTGLKQIWVGIKEFIKKQYDALLHLDLKDKTNKSILRVVIVNFVILVFVSFFWNYGLFALIAYSVVLFFILRKYLNDLRKKYEILLQSTNQLAEGHLDLPIDGDVGLFEPIQEELRRIQAGFKKAVEEEVKNERMKTELVTNVSHDLRTPLTAIITYTDLLKNEADEEKRKEYIDVLERKSLRLKVLIEDLFEISKAASRNVKMNFMKVDIVGLIKQAELENDEKIKAANLEFRWMLPDHKVIMWLDSEKTYRIFENLIVNIIKYAMPHTRVYVEMTEAMDEVHISMKNVSATELDFNPDEITERFVRGDSARNTEGSGLGLAIAKSFSELQHGKLKITTEADLFKVDIVLPKLEIPEGETAPLE